MKSVSVVIIGAGPAGIATAIQLKRGGIDFVILEKEKIGGLLRSACYVENYPGFWKGISGPGLVNQLKKHLKKLEIKVQSECITNVKKEDHLFHITGQKHSYFAEYLVLATGTKPRQYQLPGDEIINSNTLVNEIIPLMSCHGKKILIVGAGDAAFDYALNLAPANDVVIINRSSMSPALQLLRERCRNNSSIEYLKETQIKKVRERKGKLQILCANAMGETTIIADYVLTAIGRVPCTNFLDDSLMSHLDKNKPVQNLFAVGDIQNGFLRQTSIAIGDGIKAAMIITGRMRSNRR